ncbi:1,4-beta-xylanase, partial [Micromonospora sp. PPF5-17]
KPAYTAVLNALNTGGTTTPPPSTTPPPTTTPPPSGSGCTANLTVQSWPGGFVTNVHVTAGSTAVNGWTVRITLPAGTVITGTWSAQPSGTNGTVDFRNVDYNGQIGAGGSTDFGFQGTGVGPSGTPSCTAG